MKFDSGSPHTDRTAQLGAWGDLSSLFSFASPTGQSETATGIGGLHTAADYFKSLLSGDMTKITGALAPQISGIRERADQRERTASEFSNRSGGTNAIAQHAPIDLDAAIDSLISESVGGAARNLGALSASEAGIGNGLLSLAESSATTRGNQAGGARQNDINNAQQGGQAAAMLLAALFGGDSSGGGG